MSTIGKSQPSTSATLMTLSLAICLGAAARTTAAPALRATESAPRMGLSADQRQALASLLSQLSDAARELHRTPASVQAHAPVAAISPGTVAGEFISPRSVGLASDHADGPPTPPLRPGLLNLPPPADR